MAGQLPNPRRFGRLTQASLLFHILDPLGMQTGQALDHVGMLLRQVLRLGDILAHIAQEGFGGRQPAALILSGGSAIYQLPVVRAHGPLFSTLGLPVQDVVWRCTLG